MHVPDSVSFLHTMLVCTARRPRRLELTLLLLCNARLVHRATQTSSTVGDTGRGSEGKCWVCTAWGAATTRRRPAEGATIQVWVSRLCIQPFIASYPIFLVTTRLSFVLYCRGHREEWWSQKSAGFPRWRRPQHPSSHTAVTSGVPQRAGPGGWGGTGGEEANVCRRSGGRRLALSTHRWSSWS